MMILLIERNVLLCCSCLSAGDLFFIYTFLLVQKSNKKGPPKTITARFRVGSLIKLLHYCDFNYRALIVC